MIDLLVENVNTQSLKERREKPLQDSVKDLLEKERNQHNYLNQPLIFLEKSPILSRILFKKIIYSLL
jgi:hypothetical protein